MPNEERRDEGRAARRGWGGGSIPLDPCSPGYGGQGEYPLLSGGAVANQCLQGFYDFVAVALPVATRGKR